jgi:hypothetical protein
MVLIALAFIGLAAFIGLTVDAGILFIQIGHLRRAVDASSIAAANQFREGRTLTEIEAAADEFINLNSLNPANAEIFICDIADPTAGNTNPYHELELCPEDEDGDGIHGPPADPDDTFPPRKYVRVIATMPVEFSFLPIIGFGSIDIQANAISEAASVDIVLVIDTSESMAYDADCGDKDLGDPLHDEPSEYDDDAWAETNLPGGLGAPDGEDDCSSTGGVIGGFKDDYLADPDKCNDVYPAMAGIQGVCQPFEHVRTAALSLLGRMYFPYDRMAIISFDRSAVAQLDLSADTTSISSSIGSLTVFKLGGCPGWTFVNGYNPSFCTSTNIADGLMVGGAQFGSFLREEAVLIVILLSDGSANAGTDSFGMPICPGSTSLPTWVQPFCKDGKFEVGSYPTDPAGHGDYGYDAEDAAVDQGAFVGCPEGNSFDPATTDCIAPGQGAVVFTIGLGEKLINDDKCDPAHLGGCEEDQGEKLLRYIAAIGDDGDPGTDPCSGVSKGLSCGNYYFSPTGAGLLQVFEAIASRIFTRIIH